jgi:hypothetical protein
LSAPAAVWSTRFPALGEHAEVREHALKPLGEEVKGLLSDEVKPRLAELFAEWQDRD